MAGYRKEHDWFVENLANPSFSNTEFKSVGINASNTSLGPIDAYLNSPEIQRLEVFLTNGRFDENKVRAYYATIAKSYNNLARDTYEQDLDADSKAIFSLYNLFVSPERRQTTDPVSMSFQPNPDHTTFGLVGFNTPGKITKTPEELSESLPIWDPDTLTWTTDTPEDSFFKYFFRPTVLATWDYDADINGNPTSDPSKIAYYKGQPKVNEFGEYYLEFLNGRSSAGKKLLHKTNILTREDSWLNKFDPFDNDGFDKSIWGSIALNAIKIVPLFIPYVREAYLYTNLGLGAAEALSTLGKMFVGSDNAFLNTASATMESFHTTPSEYASLHLLSMENILNMTADTLEFIKGQRLLATKAPEWFGKKIPKDTTEFNTKVSQMVSTKMQKMGSLAGKSEEAVAELNNTLRFLAAAELLQLILNYLKLGLLISKNYMAITFGTHTYETAKSLGVSDLAATILTLGAIGGQYALLSSHIGNWIFPEAKLEQLELKFIAKKLPEVIESESFKTALSSLEKAVTAGEKIKSFRDIFNSGRALVGKVYNSPMQTTALAAVAGSIASGIEMTSFSVLDDIIAETYNLSQWLTGSDHRMSSFENVGERYLSSFLGGAFAGVMSAKEIYRASKSLHELSPDQAFERLVTIVANGKTDKFLKELESTTWGNKYLSTETYSIPEDGMEIYKLGTEINNQDKLIKDAIKLLVNIIERVLKSNDAMISPSSLLTDDKTIGLVKTSLLLGSVVVKDYIGNLNKKLAELVKVQLEISGISDTETRKLEKEIQQEEKKNKDSNKKPEVPVNTLESLQEKRRELILEIHKYKTGEIMEEYMPKAIFDMSVGVNSAFINGNFITYTETKYNKKISELSLAERIEAEIDYKKWVNENKLNAVNVAYDLFSRINPVVSDYLNKLKTDGVVKDLNLGDTKILKHFLVETLRMLDLLSNDTIGGISVKDKLLEGSRNFENSTRSAIVRNIINEINSKGGREQDVKLMEALRTAIRSDEFSENRDLLYQFIDLIELSLYRDEILDLIESDLKDRKFIDPSIKKTLSAVLTNDLSRDNLIRMLFGGEDEDYIFAYENLDKLFSNRDVANVTSLESLNNRIIDLGINFEGHLREIELDKKLQNIEDFDLLNTISNFGKSISKENFDLKNLFNELDQVFRKNLKTIDKFFLGQDKLNLIELGLLTIDLFRSGTVASNNVVDDIKNIFGYNITINSIKKNSDLTVLNSDDVAVQLQTLNLLETKLKYYKQLAIYARENKFNEIANVENGFRTTLFKQINDKIDKLPLGWKGSDELKIALGGLIDLQKLSKAKFTSLSSETQEKLIREYVKYEKILHDFFLKNMSNIEDVNELAKFLKVFGLTDSKSTSIGDENFKDELALVWYLASIVALDPEQFYSNFVKSSLPGIAPTFSRMTQVNLIVSRLFNRKIFDKFIEAYNKNVDEKTMTISSDAYRFDENRVKFMNTVLLLSGAGAGKSFAILPMVINFIKSVDAKLLDNIWVASTSPIDKPDKNDSAKKLKSVWKLDNQNAFTKQQLMKMVSSEWHESINSDLELEVNDSDTSVDEAAGILKYNFKLRLDHANPPRLIVIDEIADYSELDMELIDRYAQKHGILVIAAGDLQQIGLVGRKTIKINNSDFPYVFYLCTNLFIHTFYNTANYRTENSLLDKNIIYDRVMLSLTSGDTPLDIPPYLYFIDLDKGLYGRMVFDRSRIDTKYIDMLVRTASKDERIGYVYDDENSDIYKYILENYKDLFEFFYKYPVKGEEALYYVYDLTSEPKDRSVLIKTLYTVFTRSKQGTIFIKPKRSSITNRLQSSKTDYVTVASLDFMQLENYSNDILKVLKDIYPEPVAIDTTLKARKTKPEPSKAEGSTDDTNDSNDDRTPEGVLKVPKDLEDLLYKDDLPDEPDVVDEGLFKKDNIAFDLGDDSGEITIILLEEQPVERLIVSLNKSKLPVPKRFEFSNSPTRILLSGSNWVDSDITEVFKFGLYTRFNNYTGLVKDDLLGFMELEGSSGRIDNYYGLQNLFEELNVQEISTLNYTVINDASSRNHNINVKRNIQRFLQHVRELNYRIKDRKELETEIYNLIKNTFGITLDDPYIRFIWESTKHDEKSYKDSMWYRSKKETPDDPRLTVNSAKGISIVIGAKVNGEDKALMTVSLAKLPYWKTIIKNQEGDIGNYLRELLAETQREIPSSVRPELYDWTLRKTFIQKLEDILLGKSSHKYSLGVASLYHLLKIYNYNYRGDVFLDFRGKKSDKKVSVLEDENFTLAKYFVSTGPFVFANERLGDFVSLVDMDINLRESESDIAEYFDIQDVIEAGQFTISPILVTKENVKNDSDIVIADAGRPFILVGDSSLSLEELLDVWTELAHDKTLPIRVKRVYVKNPESTLDEYMSLLAAWAASKKDLSIDISNMPLVGNDLTSFRILDHLRTTLDEQFQNFLNKAFEGTYDTRIHSGIKDEINKLFAEVEGITDSSLILEKLKQKSSYRNITYGRLFNLALRIIVDPLWFVYHAELLPLHELIKNFIESEQSSGNMKSIFYNIRFGAAYGKLVNGVSLFEVKTDELTQELVERGDLYSYSIGGKQFTVNTIMTPILTGDLYPLLARISSNIRPAKVTKDGRTFDTLTMTATGPVGNKNARQDPNVIIERVPAAKPKGDILEAKRLGLITSDDLLNKSNIKGTIKRFNDNGYPAFEFKGVTYLLTIKPAEALDNKIKSITVLSGNEILVEYEGSSNVKLTLLPVYDSEGITHFSVKQSERKVEVFTKEYSGYFDTLLMDYTNNKTDFDDNVELAGVNLLRMFNVYIEDVGHISDLNLDLFKTAYDLDANNKIKFTKENFISYLNKTRRLGVSRDIIRELSSRLEEREEEFTRSSEEIEKFNCNLIFKI